MIKALKVVAFFLLLYNGVSALFGGWQLMADPTGSRLQLPLSLLEHSPFSNYFIPGILLFITSGLLSTATAILTVIKWKYYPELIFLQGCILTGFIIIEVIMIRTVDPLQIIFGGTGLLMILLGILLYVKLKPGKV